MFSNLCLAQRYNIDVKSIEFTKTANGLRDDPANYRSTACAYTSFFLKLSLV